MPSLSFRLAFRGWLAPAFMFLLAILLLPAVGTAQSFTQVFPTLPQLTVDTTMPAVTGNTYTVNDTGNSATNGTNLQAAIDAAAAADPNLTHLISIAAGANFTGPFTLRSRAAGTGWVLLRSSAIAGLPPEGSRVGPADASNMPKLVTLTVPYDVQTEPGAHHYRFIGIEITPSPGVDLGALVALGSSAEINLSELLHDFIFDRCYVHGDPTIGGNKGIAMNANSVAVINSYISDLKATGNPDTNAVWTFNSAGPFKIFNNYLESGGENVMIGGAIPTIVGLIPSDIEIRQNHITKLVSWNPNDPAYAGTHYLVKNLLEMKSGNRVLINGNIFENVWPDAQPGFTFELTPRSDTGTWTTVSDITITNNIVHDVANGAGISGFESGAGLLNHSKNVLVGNNLLYNVGVVTTTGPGGPPGGSQYQVLNGIQNVTIDHNTGIQSGTLVNSDISANNPDFTYTNNIGPSNTYGVFCGGSGTFALDNCFSPYVFDKNVIAALPPGTLPSQYPPDNFFPNSLTDVGFVDQTNNDYHLSASSPYKNAGTDGKDIGVDMDAVNAATAGVLSGTPDSTPPTVTVSAPTSAATVTGTVTVSATVQDNVGVAGVQFKLDGVNLGSQITSLPHFDSTQHTVSFSWDTTTIANGAHTITAVASDAAGNRTTSAPVSVTVSNVAPPTPSVPTAGATDSGSSNSSSGPCFIATAAYGSPLDNAVVLLRTFRDRHLLTNRAGRAFVQWYYRVSPPLAVRIQDSPFLRGATRTVLWPLVGMVWLVLHPGVLTVALVGGGGVLGWLRSRRRPQVGVHS